MKCILVFPVKNEEWILEQTLSCNSLWADHIIVAYQESSDTTLEILKRFPKVIIIENKAERHSSNVRKLLLDTARNYSGSNAIFSLDADEIPTAHILSPAWNEQLESFSPGTALEMQWVNLWHSINQFRNDASIWSNSWKHFGFIDDRKLEYTTVNIVNDHTSRIPSPSLQTTVRLETPKILHYQFTNWERMLAKQRLYRVEDFIQKNKNLLTTLKINNTYFSTKARDTVILDDVPNNWVQDYVTKGIKLGGSEQQELYWYELRILHWMKKLGVNYFLTLDIWDIDWEKKRMKALAITDDVPSSPIVDPRNYMVRMYHSQQQLLYSTVETLRRAR